MPAMDQSSNNCLNYQPVAIGRAVNLVMRVVMRVKRLRRTIQNVSMGDRLHTGDVRCLQLHVAPLFGEYQLHVADVGTQCQRSSQRSSGYLEKSRMRLES